MAFEKTAAHLRACLKRQSATDLFAIIGYMTCSALMLLVNKLAVHHLPAPTFVLLAQLAASALFTGAAGALGWAEVDPLEWTKVKSFWLVPASFLCTVFANIKVLQHANVETFIVFRASTPLLISVADYVFLGRELPNRYSLACLLMLVVGAGGYVASDDNFSVDAYSWVAVWFAVFSFDQIYIKHAVDSVAMTTWGRVYYTNLLACFPLAAFLLMSGDAETLRTFEFTVPAVFWLTLSCACGACIAYFAFLARAALSATYFTVIGNSCKVITVFLNVMMWDKHATPAGLASLFVCLIAAYLYKPAPKRIEPLPTHSKQLGQKFTTL